MALRIRDENTFGAIVFGATLPLLLPSGVLLPMSLALSWLQTVSSFNPLTYAVDAERALFANHVSYTVVLKGLLVIGALTIAAASGATRAFNNAVA